MVHNLHGIIYTLSSRAPQGSGNTSTMYHRCVRPSHWSRSAWPWGACLSSTSQPPKNASFPPFWISRKSMAQRNARPNEIIENGEKVFHFCVDVIFDCKLLRFQFWALPYLPGRKMMTLDWKWWGGCIFLVGAIFGCKLCEAVSKVTSWVCVPWWTKASAAYNLFNAPGPATKYLFLLWLFGVNYFFMIVSWLSYDCLISSLLFPCWPHRLRGIHLQPQIGCFVIKKIFPNGPPAVSLHRVEL